MNYAKHPMYDEAVRRYAPFVGTSYEVGVTLSGRPVEVTQYSEVSGLTPAS